MTSPAGDTRDTRADRLRGRISVGHAGAERLLLKLAQQGLRPSALRVAAALVAQLDDEARQRSE